MQDACERAFLDWADEHIKYGTPGSLLPSIFSAGWMAAKSSVEVTIPDAVNRAWPLLKREYEYRHEDSECGGDEIEEGLDMLKEKLCIAMRGNK